jgi:hypothetical protein
MTIPEPVIRAWSQRPGSMLSSWTTQVLHEALDGAKRLSGVDFEIFLQGSFVNETNISGNSDVDLVILMKLPFEEDIRDLEPRERDLFHQCYRDTDYGWDEFREDVLSSLRESYFVHEGRKCIDIRNWDSLLRVPADILPAVEYRRYRSFLGFEHQAFDEGVFFRDSSGRPIRNFPKRHLANGRRKDVRTQGRFKQMVRAFKNARNQESTCLPDGTAPSYFLECLLYNVPDKCFRGELDTTYCSCLTWLLEADDAMLDFLCQNELVRMFGEGSDQWNINSAQEVLTALNTQQQTYS